MPGSIGSYRIIRELSAARTGVYLAEDPDGLLVIKQRSPDRLRAEYKAMLACRGPLIGEPLKLGSEGLFLKYYEGSCALSSFDESRCREALLAGKLEVDEMPLDETLYIMDMMDELRRKMGVHYPMD